MTSKTNARIDTDKMRNNYAKRVKNDPSKGVKSAFFQHYAENIKLAETRVLLKKYSVF